MRFLILLPIFILSGCLSMSMPGYISRVDHPYDRKFYAGFEKVVSSTMFVLKNKGWKIDSESDPALYERDDRYDNSGYQNLLIITRVRNNFPSITSMHLNLLIHSIGNACDVEVRYEAQTPLIKKFTTVRNDRVVQDILDAVEREINK
jgi:hypothetical protein